jgi:hypothetical protein
MRALPPVLGAILLPLSAVLVPLVFSIGTATTEPFVQADPYDLFNFLIYDVFTESIPFMLLGIAVGFLSPAAGVLFVVAYGIGNVAATIVTNELDPLLPALYGRFASCVILWLLVVEIPLTSRAGFERLSRGMAARGHLIAIGGASLLATLLLSAFAVTAAMLVGVVFWLTRSWGSGPTLRASNTLEVSPEVLIVPAAILAVLLLYLRYPSPDAPFGSAEPAGPPPSPAQRAIRYGISVGLALTLLAGAMSQVIDLVVLVVGLILGRPIAQAILRATRLAAPLARIPWLPRVGLGAAVSIAFSGALLSLLGYPEISRWFPVVVAIAGSYVILQIMLEADQVAAAVGSPHARPDAAVAVGSGLAVLSFMQLSAFALPAPVFADAFGDWRDTAFIIGMIIAPGAAMSAAMLMGQLAGGLEEDKPGKSPPGYLRRAPHGGLPGANAGGGAGRPWRSAGPTKEGGWDPGTGPNAPRGPVPRESDPDPPADPPPPPPPPPAPPPGPNVS